MACLLSAREERMAKSAAWSVRVVVFINNPLRFDHGDDGVAWYDHHLDPGELIVDAACVDLGQLYVVGHYVADFVQWLFIFAACKDLPDAAFVESLAAGWCVDLRRCCSAHADIPQ